MFLSIIKIKQNKIFFLFNQKKIDAATLIKVGFNFLKILNYKNTVEF